MLIVEYHRNQTVYRSFLFCISSSYRLRCCIICSSARLIMTFRMSMSIRSWSCFSRTSSAAARCLDSSVRRLSRTMTLLTCFTRCFCSCLPTETYTTHLNHSPPRTSCSRLYTAVRSKLHTEFLKDVWTRYIIHPIFSENSNL